MFSVLVLKIRCGEIFGSKNSSRLSLPLSPAVLVIIIFPVSRAVSCVTVNETPPEMVFS